MPGVQGLPVRVRVDGDARDPHLAQSPNDADGDLTPVGDQDLAEHLRDALPPGVGPQRALQLHPGLDLVPEKPGQPPPAALQGVMSSCSPSASSSAATIAAASSGVGGVDPQSGMFPCLRGGRSGRLVRIICRALIR